MLINYYAPLAAGLDMNTNVQAKAEMLIRRPVGEVFGAFINPEITTKFWYTKSTGRLEIGKRVTWEWEMYGVHSHVDVKAIDENRRILIEWEGYSGPETVEWTFVPYGSNATFVSVTNSGFRGNEDEIVKQALDSTGGFTWLLAGLKAFLEHGIQLNLVADAHPKNLVLTS
jgi:uncharacterized protein YndB with AHSA1/START domain